MPPRGCYHRLLRQELLKKLPLAVRPSHLIARTMNPPACIMPCPCSNRCGALAGCVLDSEKRLFCADDLAHCPMLNVSDTPSVGTRRGSKKRNANALAPQSPPPVKKQASGDDDATPVVPVKAELPDGGDADAAAIELPTGCVEDDGTFVARGNPLVESVFSTFPVSRYVVVEKSPQEETPLDLSALPEPLRGPYASADDATNSDDDEDEDNDVTANSVEKVFAGASAGNVCVRVGTLTILRWGRVVRSTPGYNTATHVFPVGFRSRRVFWGPGLAQREVYTCDILPGPTVESRKSVLAPSAGVVGATLAARFRIQCVSNPELRFEAPSSDGKCKRCVAEALDFLVCLSTRRNLARLPMCSVPTVFACRHAAWLAWFSLWVLRDDCWRCGAIVQVHWQRFARILPATAA